MNIPVVQLESVTVAYQGSEALSNISLQIHANDCIAILGPNGAGKTTLLSLLNGFSKPSSGTVRLWGNRLHHYNATRLRRRIGYVAQTQPTDPHLPITLRESVMTGVYGHLGSWRSKPSRSDLELVETLLEQLHLTHLAHRPLGKLSGGEMRRTMIARALAQRPELLLMDEPTASLDDASRETVLSLPAQWHKQGGLTLLWVTHDLDALPDSCTRMLRMHNGRIIQDVRQEVFSCATDRTASFAAAPACL